jgi:hypothetical protein
MAQAAPVGVADEAAQSNQHRCQRDQRGSFGAQNAWSQCDRLEAARQRRSLLRRAQATFWTG